MGGVHIKGRGLLGGGSVVVCKNLVKIRVLAERRHSYQEGSQNIPLLVTAFLMSHSLSSLRGGGGIGE